MTRFGYPVMLELSGRRCVVIGETAVREGKVEGLLAGGADDVSVVAMGPAARLAELETVDGVEVSSRGWRPADFDGAWLVVASSRDADERASMAREARSRGALVNVMDDVEACDWSAPAVVRRGDLVLAIATGGAAPALARKLREHLRPFRDVRAETISTIPTLAERAQRWSDALDLDEAASLVRAGRADELRERLRTRLVGVGAARKGESS